MPTVKFVDNLTTVASQPADPYTVKINLGTWSDTTKNYTDNMKSITGWIADDSLEFTTDNQWTELYSLIGGGSIETLNNILVGAAGFSLRTKSMYKKIWTGTNTIELKVGVIFQSETNPKTEVWDNIWDLYQVAVPTQGNTFTESLNQAQFYLGGKKPIQLIQDKDALKRIESGIKGFFESGANSPIKIPIISDMANFNRQLVNELLSIRLLSAPGLHYHLNEVKIGKFITLRNVQLRNITISPSLSNIGTTPVIPGQNQNQPFTYPNYAKVDLSLMTNTIWTADDIDDIKKSHTPTPQQETLF